jgi:hypothetical protein
MIKFVLEHRSNRSNITALPVAVQRAAAVRLIRDVNHRAHESRHDKNVKQTVCSTRAQPLIHVLYFSREAQFPVVSTRNWWNFVRWNCFAEPSNAHRRKLLVDIPSEIPRRYASSFNEITLHSNPFPRENSPLALPRCGRGHTSDYAAGIFRALSDRYSARIDRAVASYCNEVFINTLPAR